MRLNRDIQLTIVVKLRRNKMNIYTYNKLSTFDPEDVCCLPDSFFKRQPASNDNKLSKLAQQMTNKCMDIEKLDRAFK
jgi:hypothetical protein